MRLLGESPNIEQALSLATFVMINGNEDLSTFTFTNELLKMALKNRGTIALIDPYFKELKVNNEVSRKCFQTLYSS